MLGRKTTDFVTLKDVPAEPWIKAYADYLKKSQRISLPQWVDLVKTGNGREVVPNDEDWFYVRAAAVVRKVYLRPQLGVGRMAHIQLYLVNFMSCNLDGYLCRYIFFM